MPWIALGTLVMINNDEGDYFQPIFAQSTHPSMPYWSGATPSVIGSGYGRPRWVQKWSKMIFEKIVHRLLGVLKQVVGAILSHLGPI